jgi:TrmH family RNA methyltransferase
MLVKSKVKYIQSLSQKQFRDTENAFVAEGPKLVEELIQAGNVKIKEIFAIDSWLNLHQSKAEVAEISETMLERISFQKTPNQVLAVCTKPVFNSPLSVSGKLILLLDGIQDPGNLGTIIRTADWFGVQQVVCSENCADVFSPKVVQATMGSIARVQVLYASLSSIIDQFSDKPLLAAALEGQEISKMDGIQEGMLMIGNESKGITPALLQRATKKIKIPGNGDAESLNAAVATGILLAFLLDEKGVR